MIDVESIFHRALEIKDTNERKRFLDNECDGNESLRQDVDDLLKAADSDTNLLDTPVSGISAIHRSSDPERQILKKVDGYKILQQLGEGGFGIVYMAEQTEPVSRKVAIKVIKPGMNSKEVIARFEAERQVLAMMEHPNIARVFDAGTTDDGLPFFVMELVRGFPITQYADENRLDTDRRLDLFTDVCDAVQHAHRKGIIHRDIKPSNVMVTLRDGNPIVKVIDFGVSKALNQKVTEKTLFTRYGQMIGTPQYMSPEQAEMSELDIDTRSDVYSLGVMLYELLTGSTPLTQEQLRDAGYAEMQRLIKEEDAQRLSDRISTLGEALPAIAHHRRVEPGRLRKLLRGELDWIVLRSLEKERERRYDSPDSFARDIRRYLSGGVVEACPPSMAYRVTKFVRKNRSIVVATSIVIASLVIGLVAAMAGLLQAQKSDRDKGVALKEKSMSLFESNVVAARAAVKSLSPGQRIDALAAIRQAEPLIDELGLGEDRRDELRNLAVDALGRVDISEPVWEVEFRLGHHSLFAVYPSADLYVIADRSLATHFQLRRMSDDSLIARTPEIVDGIACQFNIEQNMLGAIHRVDKRPQLSIWRLRKGSFELVFSRLLDRLSVPTTFASPEHFDHVFDIESHPNLLCVINGNEVEVVDVPTYETISRIPLDFAANHVRVSHIGETIMAWHRFDGVDGSAEFIDVESGNRIESNFNLAAIRSDGRVAITSDKLWVHCVDTVSGNAFAAIRSPTPLSYISVHPSGELFAIAGWDHRIRVFEKSGEHVLSIGGTLPRFTSDGKHLSYRHGGTISVAEVTIPTCRNAISSAVLGLEQSNLEGIRFHQSGLAAISGGCGGIPKTIFYDFQRSVPLFPIHDRQGHVVSYLEKEQTFLVAGENGFVLWPASIDGSKCTVGPPSTVPLGLSTHLGDIDVDQEQSIAVVTGKNGLGVLFKQAGDWKSKEIAHNDGLVNQASISPDGRLVSCGGWNSSKIRIFNTDSGERVTTLRDLGSDAFFDGTGKELILLSRHIQAIAEVGSWRIREFPFSMYPLAARDFSRTQNTTAFGTLQPPGIALFDLNQKKTLVRFPAFDDQSHEVPIFVDENVSVLVHRSHDESIANQATRLVVWDLKKLRAELKEMNLDWDAPPIEKSILEFEKPAQEFELLTEPKKSIRDERLDGARTLLNKGLDAFEILQNSL